MICCKLSFYLACLLIVVSYLDEIFIQDVVCLVGKIYFYINTFVIIIILLNKLILSVI
ncbi:MAG: hypothetical protein CMIDDMOC_00781 [Sodalis sp. Fle]|nr:MAG: hypothetical protein CMIDDMOC_00781 [Sodalis sp. Fle]